MNKDSVYWKQVQLLVRILPLIDTEACFALKGGTAINLFYRPLPRLSVDIDLMYLPLEGRESAIPNIHAALHRIAELIRERIRDSHVEEVFEESDSLRLNVELDHVRIKIELSPVTRGSIYHPVKMHVVAEVEKEFGYAEMLVSAFPDLFAGKLCAGLDRQHPRDLFDILGMYQNEGFTEELRKAFMVFLISHYRPMAELLNPHRIDLSGSFKSEFLQMTRENISLKTLEETREKLIHDINLQLTADERQFIYLFKSKKPDWTLLGLPNADEISQLPAVRWKMINLEKLEEKKHIAALEKLKLVLNI